MQFKEALERGDIGYARYYIYDAVDDELKEYCGKHMAALSDDTLITMFKKSGEDDTSRWILTMILLYVEHSRLDAILGELRPDSETMRHALGHTDIFCKPHRLIYLLPKVCNKDLPTMNDAIRLGVTELFRNSKVRCIDPLLSALESSDLPGAYETAIRAVFDYSIVYKDERNSFAWQLFDHPAITKEDYVKGMKYKYWRTLRPISQICKFRGTGVLPSELLVPQSFRRRRRSTQMPTTCKDATSDRN